MTDAFLVEGQRFGRFVVLRDTDGRVYAIAAGAVAAACETDDGTLLMLPGALTSVLGWLDGRG